MVQEESHLFQYIWFTDKMHKDLYGILVVLTSLCTLAGMYYLTVLAPYDDEQDIKEAGYISGEIRVNLALFSENAGTGMHRGT